MSYKIALAGNPNSGKTTLFNALTGSNQFVGNWPGVTVEKKEGKLKGCKDVVVTDLPGIYSLSPYTLEEVVARNYLLQERPDAILNIVDGTNLERNLYLSTQLLELGIPVVMAVNMMDVVEKNGDQINLKRLEKELGCRVISISALKGINTKEAAQLAVNLAKDSNRELKAVHRFSSQVEDVLEQIQEKLEKEIPEEQKRFYAVKLFERDEKILASMKNVPDIEALIKKTEEALDDDAESIITNERYDFITSIIKESFIRKRKENISLSDKIDRVVTNRWLALPIFALVMFIVYYISVTTVGGIATDWANDGVFGDGWHLFGIGAGIYKEEAEEWGAASNVINAFIEKEEAGWAAEALDAESEDYDPAAAKAALEKFSGSIDKADTAGWTLVDEETLAEEPVTYTGAQLARAVSVFDKYGYEEPDPSGYGIWVPGIPALLEAGLSKVDCAEWLHRLIMDGIVAGVGAVLGFVPQILILFLFLAFLEGCGYMARIAFIMDRIFRKFGLSGKSFIPMLIGSGCGIPGIMASRTIENDRDRKMTIMTTTFIPCSAKLPFIAMVAGAVFGGAPWVAPSAYFLGIGAIICSGIVLKKTKLFKGDPAPFVMELPAYHLPTIGSVFRSMWERGWSFMKKAGTIILLSTIAIWFATYFGFVDGSFQMLSEDQIDLSILASMGRALCWIFIPQGFGNWQATVASVTGLVAKENIVGTMGVLFGGGDAGVYANIAGMFTAVSGYAFLAFNLLCAPCFAAMGAIKREMNNRKWFWIAIGYQCGFAYLVSMVVNQIGGLIAGTVSFNIFTIAAIAAAAVFFYLLFRPYQESKTLKAAGVRI